MNRRLFLAVFEREEDLLDATRTVRDQRLPIVDVYTPYAVHGLDEAMGLKPSRLSRACLICGLIGALLAMWFQYWTMTSDWPVNVGGRPWNSWPAFMPVTFETMVLFAGFGVVFAFLAVARLFPGKRAVLPIPEVTSNRFALVLAQTSADFDAGAVRRLLQQFHAVYTEEHEEEATPPRAAGRLLRKLNWVLVVALVLTVVLNWSLGTDPSRPNVEFLPEMVRSVPYDSYAPHPKLPGGSTLQPPQPGTIARGQMPLHYQATPEDAARAGKELTNPLPDEPRWRARGSLVYANYCQICHGPTGQGDGHVATVARLGKFPLVDAKLKEPAMKDGQIFHTLTFGKGAMASYAGQLSREDRWAVILHVRRLQQAEEKKP